MVTAFRLNVIKSKRELRRVTCGAVHGFWMKSARGLDAVLTNIGQRLHAYWVQCGSRILEGLRACERAIERLKAHLFGWVQPAQR